VRDEIYRIGYEAIHNAWLHSRARRLEVELKYGSDLTLQMKDNGVGFDPTIVDHGKEGHFGLTGMRERAARIGAKLTLTSSARSGTEVNLIVPGKIIFPKSRTSTLAKLKSLLFAAGSQHQFELTESPEEPFVHRHARLRRAWIGT